MLENSFFTKRVVQALEQAAQSSGGVPDPGVFKSHVGVAPGDMA